MFLVPVKQCFFSFIKFINLCKLFKNLSKPFNLYNFNFFWLCCRGCSVRKSGLRNFAKFAEKHLCQSLLFNKVAGVRLATLLKKRLWYRCFSVSFCEISKNSFFTEHLWATASTSMPGNLLITLLKFQAFLSGSKN